MGDGKFGGKPLGKWKLKSVWGEEIPDWSVSLFYFFLLFFAAIDYIHFLHKEKKKQEEEVSVLRKEVMALKIMKTWADCSPTFLAEFFFSTYNVLANSELSTCSALRWILKEMLILDKERKLLRQKCFDGSPDTAYSRGPVWSKYRKWNKKPSNKNFKCCVRVFIETIRL